MKDLIPPPEDMAKAACFSRGACEVSRDRRETIQT